MVRSRRRLSNTRATRNRRNSQPPWVTARQFSHASHRRLREQLGESREPAALDKDEERFRLLDAVSQFLIARCPHTPLVLVLDDLHWADRGTVGLLNHVAHNVPPIRCC